MLCFCFSIQQHSSLAVAVLLINLAATALTGTPMKMVKILNWIQIPLASHRLAGPTKLFFYQ